jgi:predicted porin
VEINVTQEILHSRKAIRSERIRGTGWTSLALVLSLATSGVAFAQKTGPAASVADDDALTWHGITLYGIVDIGVQYDSHGAPFSDYFPGGSSDIVQKYGRESVTGLTPSNLSQSRVGLQGYEPFYEDWAAIFKVETYFNPQAGTIPDALKSLVLMNGRGTTTQNVNLDSSVAGEAFETAIAGVSSKTYGTITFGRQLTLLADGISKYDPNYGSQAFSLIGLSGTYAGGGDTEDKRVDDSLKYYVTYDNIVHGGLMYKFNNSQGGAQTLFQIEGGGEYAGASVDAYYAKVKSAISASSLSSAQVGELGTAAVGAGLPAGAFSVGNSLSATISDNTAFAVMGLYKFDPLKFFAGYEHIKYANPTDPLGAGTVDLSGYVLAFVNNDAYSINKILQVYWAGARYTVVPNLDLTVAYYGYHQNSYATGKDAGCSSNVAGSCSGHFEAFSLDADYTFNKHFDAYVGAMYSAVYDGVANGYVDQRNNIDPTAGVRFKF